MAPPVELAAAVPASTHLLEIIAAGTAGVTGRPFLRSLVEHLASAFDAEVAFVAERLPDAPESAVVLAAWPGPHVLAEGLRFDVAGTPCELTDGHDVVCVPEGAFERWSDDSLLAEHRLDAYLAICLRSESGALLGHVGVLSRRPLRPTRAELAVVSIFAGRAASELERRRYASALEASRRRLLEAGDEERRRLGRDLHDGLQQQVVALVQRLDLAALQAGDPSATEALAGAAARLREISGQVRDFARGLHPSGLDELGLAAALHALVAHAALPTSLVAVTDEPLPDTLALTAYFLVSEALANAAKHAGASRAWVAVTVEAGRVHVEVGDDGGGGARVAFGGGLAGLRERVAILGGTLALDSPRGGGTRLHATLPLAGEEAA